MLVPEYGLSAGFQLHSLKCIYVSSAAEAAKPVDELDTRLGNAGTALSSQSETLQQAWAVYHLIQQMRHTFVDLIALLSFEN